MPSTRKRKSRRPVYVKPRWWPTEEQRRELRPLLADVNPEAGEGDPAFLALLAYWQGCEPPWDAFPLPHVYQCRGGTWLTAGVEAVLAAIQAHLEASS